MDDSFPPGKSILTAIPIPVARFSDLRLRFHEVMKDFISPQPGTCNLTLPELHGKSMLPNHTDDDKLLYFGKIADYVIENELPVYRVGYNRTPATEIRFSSDKELRGLVWDGMMHVIEPILSESFVIPIMDSCDLNERSKYSRPLQEMGVLQSIGFGKAIAIQGVANLIGEVYFADSSVSALTQVVDMVSYLRLKLEAGKGSAFQESLQNIARKLDVAMAYEKVHALSLT